MKLQNSLIQEFLTDHIIQFTYFMYETLLPEDLKRHAEDDSLFWLKSSPSLPPSFLLDLGFVSDCPTITEPYIPQGLV